MIEPNPITYRMLGRTDVADPDARVTCSCHHDDGHEATCDIVAAHTYRQTIIDTACEPREIVSITRESERVNGPRGYDVRLHCGHEFWTPIPPAWRPMVCAQCVTTETDG